MAEQNAVTKPFSMLEYGSYTAGIGLFLSLIIKFYITPNLPHLVEIANLAAPLVTPILSFCVALFVGRFGTSPEILRMNKNIKNSIKNLKKQIQANSDLLTEEDLNKLKKRLSEHINIQSQIGVSIHTMQDLLNKLN
ncbi:FlxA-like family protein [Mannheimia massilioguelmaensis]|uniref:FlxA-like family protein n=1 Tax=Mannheimia massilioguelmaensis TaxID=1604354 RepID=UPI0005C9DDC8|nr:FlxA-like family protein [Mannheimia massilioguelmaensis]